MGGGRGLDLTLRHDLADVQTCLDNAKRLRSDTRLTSRETRALLLELALEEIGKGATLCLRIFVKRKSSGILELSDEGETLRNALITIATDHERHLIANAFDLNEFVSNFDLDALFSKHPPKLQAVSRLAKIARTSLRIMKSHPREFMKAVDATPKLRRELRRVVKVSESDLENFGEIKQAEYLSGLRERSTYVGVNDRREFVVSPHVEPVELRRLASSYRAAVAMVQSWIIVHRELLES
jgi:hypothetical protein